MRRILVTLTLCAAVSSLNGCVLALGNDAGGDSNWSSSEHRDTSLARAIRSGLDADPATHEADISVYTDGDKVYLTGTVRAPETLEKAVQIAMANSDTTSVHCRIEVIR